MLLTTITLHQKFFEPVTGVQLFMQPAGMFAPATPGVAIAITIFHREPRRLRFLLSGLHELESELVRLLFQLNNRRALQLLDACVDVVARGSELVVCKVCELGHGLVLSDV